MMQTGKLVKVFVYFKGKRIELEPDEARSMLWQLQGALGVPSPVPVQVPVYIPVPQPAVPSNPQPPFGYPIVTCSSQQ